METIVRLLKVLAFIVIVLLIVVGSLYAIKIFETNRIEKLQYEASQNYELQYESMIKTIKENSDYYENFSKEFISVFEEFGYDRFKTSWGFYERYDIENRLEYEFNYDLLGREGYVNYARGLTYVKLKYHDSILMFDYSQGEDFYYSDEFWVVYIPYEYMDEETIATISREDFGSGLMNVKDNLFIAWIPENRH
jgi:hypothetical protein